MGLQARPMLPPRPMALAPLPMPMGMPNSNFEHPQYRPVPTSFGKQFRSAPIAQAALHQPFQPPRQIANKPKPRPEPMDVDRSRHSRQLNYMNRP